MEKPSRYERLMMTLQHKEPDRVVCSPLLCGASRRLVGASYPDFSQKPEVTAKAILAGLELIGGDIVIPMTDLSIEAADFGQKIVYPENSTPHPDYADPLIKDVNEYRKLKRIDLKGAKRMQSVIQTARLLMEQEELKGLVGGFCFGPLGILSMLRGVEHLFRDCVLYPSEVMVAMETVTDVLIEYVEAQCDAGVSSVCIDTLFASWSGLSKDLWEKIEGPFAREVANAIRRRQCGVLVHNCGHGIYFDSQIRFMEPAAISFAHLPDDCSDRKELKKRYGDQVTLIGYINTPMLNYGNFYQVMEECKKQIYDLAPGGGYILAPGCEFPPNAPLEKALAIVKAAELYG